MHCSGKWKHITQLWSFSYWDQSLLFADPWKCCSIYHPLSPSKIFLRCRATLKIRICFLQDWISVVYSSFGYFHGDTRQRLEWQSKIRKFRTRNVNFNYDSLSCETTQSLRFQMNGQAIVVCFFCCLHSDAATVFVLKNYRANITAPF